MVAAVVTIVNFVAQGCCTTIQYFSAESFLMANCLICTCCSIVTNASNTYV